MGKQWKQWETILGGSKITADGECSHEIKRRLFLGRKAMTNLDSLLKNGAITLPTKVCLIKAMVLPVMYGCSHVWMWKLDHKEDWETKNSCFWTVVLKKTLESTLDCRQIKAVSPEGNQSWILIDAEASILWPHDAKANPSKDPDAGKDRMWEEKRTMGWDGWMTSLNGWTWVWASSKELVMDREAWHAAVHGVTKSWTQLSTWSELSWEGGPLPLSCGGPACVPICGRGCHCCCSSLQGGGFIQVAAGSLGSHSTLTSSSLQRDPTNGTESWLLARGF